MRLLLDTSVLIDGDPVPEWAEAAISVVSISELTFGLLRTDDPDTRAWRAVRLGTVESRFDALPVTSDVSRAWGALQSHVSRAGAQPRKRAADLLIAATAQVHDALLVTSNANDFRHVTNFVEVRRPADLDT